MRLADIQKTVQQIAEAVAAVVKVEVEIADDQLMRVAGTGKTQRNVLRSMAGEDFAYQWTMRTGQALVIRDPGHEEVCKPCVHREACPETGEISCPIFLDDKPIGVIGLLAFDRDQRERLFENQANIINFLEKMADLLAAKLKDQQKVESLVRRFAQWEQADPFAPIMGNSTCLSELKELARKVAHGDSTVLIQGESGTGKELFARAIHQASPRAQEPLVSINCGAIPDNLLESELFGYEEGAFTGARKGGKAGKFELADGGTLFLDEIGDMPLALQAKLLRVLQEKRVERVGSVTGGRAIDVRVIAATNRDLPEMVRQGAFRKDLYYRLHVIPLVLPTLAERREDVLMIANHYLHRYAAALGKTFRGLSLPVQHLLLQYDWPGNIRELANAIEYAVNMETEALIMPENLPAALREGRWQLRATTAGEQALGAALTLNLKRLEKQAISQALALVHARREPKEAAAELLGISRATLFRKIKDYQLS